MNELVSLAQMMVIVAATALPIIGILWLVAGRGTGRAGFGGTRLF